MGKFLILAAGAGGLLVLFVLADPPRDNLWLKTLFDFGHALAFGIAAVCVLALWPLQGPGKTAPKLRDYTFAWAAATGLGLLVELVQQFTGRDAEIEDAIRDGVGAAAFLLAAAATRPSPRLRLAARAGLARAACAILAVAMMCGAGARLAWVSWAYTERERDLPRVLAFDASWLSTFLVTTFAFLEAGPPSPGWKNAPAGKVGRLRFQPAHYSGIGVEEVSPDWTPYDRLAFEAYNPGSKPAVITLRIDDEKHDMRSEDRFNREITLAPGPNTIEIDLHDVKTAPQGREMDMSRIRRVIVFAYLPTTSFELELSDFVLRKGTAG